MDSSDDDPFFDVMCDEWDEKWANETLMEMESVEQPTSDPVILKSPVIKRSLEGERPLHDILKKYKLDPEAAPIPIPLEWYELKNPVGICEICRKSWRWHASDDSDGSFKPKHVETDQRCNVCLKFTCSECTAINLLKFGISGVTECSVCYMTRSADTTVDFSWYTKGTLRGAH